MDTRPFYFVNLALRKRLLWSLLWKFPLAFIPILILIGTAIDANPELPPHLEWGAQWAIGWGWILSIVLLPFGLIMWCGGILPENIRDSPLAKMLTRGVHTRPARVSSIIVWSFYCGATFAFWSWAYALNCIGLGWTITWVCITVVEYIFLLGLIFSD